MVFDFLPLSIFFLATVAVAVLAVEAGYRLGVFERNRTGKSNDAPVGAMVGATMALLAFLMGFTFNAAAARFESRRQTVLEEANAVGTCYLRAAMLAEPHRAEVRQMLREYVDLRLQAVAIHDLALISKSEEYHNRLWLHAVAAGEKNPGSIVVGLFISSLNDVIDIHAKRLLIGVRSRLPSTIWTVLYAVTLLGLAAIGYQAGIAGAVRSWPMLVICIALAVVIWLIADLDRPQEGTLKVSQQALIDARNSMTEK